MQTSAAPRPDKSKTEDVNKNKGGETQSDDLLPSEWDFMLMRKPTRERTKGNKYMFLTERDTTYVYINNVIMFHYYWVFTVRALQKHL